MGAKETASMCTTEAPRSDDGLGHLHDALEQARREEQAGRRRRAVVLAALCLLLLAAGSGLALAILRFLRPPHDHSALLARHLVLAASAMSLIYVAVHVRGARSNRLRPPGPPHFFGEYTLAAALMVSRLAIAVWIAVLVATAIMLASTPSLFAAGVGGATSPSLSLGALLPLLHLVVCLVAMYVIHGPGKPPTPWCPVSLTRPSRPLLSPSFFVIAATIESHPAPFATAGLSPARPPLRAFRSDESADDIDEHISISRRMSMQRAFAAQESTDSLEVPTAGHASQARSRSQPGPGLRPLRLAPAHPRTDDDAKTELMANSPVKAAHRARPRTSRSAPPAPPPYSVPPVPPLPPLYKVRSLPQLKNAPGAWPRAKGLGRTAVAPTTGMMLSRQASSLRASSLDPMPPSRKARRHVSANPGATTIHATQLTRPSAAYRKDPAILED